MCDLGLCKEKNSKNPSLLWEWVGRSRSHLEFFIFLKSSQNSSKPVLIFCCIQCVFWWYLLKIVNYYDLSVLSMSVMGFQKKSLDGSGELHPSLF